jgi:hypothetical protein
MSAMDVARRDGSLVRWPGGFWTGARERRPYTHKDVTIAPSWYVRSGVIKDLLYQGKLTVVETHPRGFATKVRPT